MELSFFKYQGTGNDFIVIDNRDEKIELSTSQIKSLCDRRFGIGADGLMELRLQEGFDFKMVYYNADGREGSMCGNGGRCLVKFAYDRGLLANPYRFMASDGPHEATVERNGWIRLKMKDVENVERHSSYDLLDTGSPHFVKQVTDLETFNVASEGRDIRNSDRFKEQGVNVNFVETTGQSSIFVRTYERGVEDETFSCGTGVTAAALMSAHNERGFNHIDINTIGGKLYVEYDRADENKYTDVWLCGPATFVFKGNLTLDNNNN